MPVALIIGVVGLSGSFNAMNNTSLIPGQKNARYSGMVGQAGFYFMSASNFCP